MSEYIALLREELEITKAKLEDADEARDIIKMHIKQIERDILRERRKTHESAEDDRGQAFRA